MDAQIFCCLAHGQVLIFGARLKLSLSSIYSYFDVQFLGVYLVSFLVVRMRDASLCVRNTNP